MMVPNVTLAQKWSVRYALRAHTHLPGPCMPGAPQGPAKEADFSPIASSNFILLSAPADRANVHPAVYPDPNRAGRLSG
jgi:hypothetical protein